MNQGSEDGQDEAPMWTRSGDEWKPAATAFRQALDALEGEWSVFVDTDHLARSPLTKVALAAVEDVIIPQSLILGDFYRLFQDPTNNALFDHVMLPMSADGSLRAKVRKIVFTKVQSKQDRYD